MKPRKYLHLFMTDLFQAPSGPRATACPASATTSPACTAASAPTAGTATSATAQTPDSQARHAAMVSLIHVLGA